MDAPGPITFVPPHQPREGREASFTLKPLDLKSLYQVQASMDGRGVPSWAGIEVSAQCIAGWSGILRKDGSEDQFSRARVRAILAGQSDVDWMIWLGQIAGRLYEAALLEETERKN